MSQGTERILIREYRRSYKTTTPIFEVDRVYQFFIYQEYNIKNNETEYY
nr:hypothetical protein [Rickettsia monacensis]